MNGGVAVWLELVTSNPSDLLNYSAECFGLCIGLLFFSDIVRKNCHHKSFFSHLTHCCQACQTKAPVPTPPMLSMFHSHYRRRNAICRALQKRDTGLPSIIRVPFMFWETLAVDNSGSMLFLAQQITRKMKSCIRSCCKFYQNWAKNCFELIPGFKSCCFWQFCFLLFMSVLECVWCSSAVNAATR